MPNQFAPPGGVFVCRACGKQSRDLYGTRALSHGWDESCSRTAVLCLEDSLVLNDDAEVIRAEPYRQPKPGEPLR